jgi:uncharacterized phage-associated protein
MSIRETSVKASAPQLSRAVSAVQDYFRTEFDQEFPEDVVEAALKDWVDRKMDVVIEEIPERLTSPGSADSIDFTRLLRKTASPAVSASREAILPETSIHPVFTGNRTFSLERMTAMIEYLARKGTDVYKTKLNKLLFYADMAGYYLTGKGMSGAVYVNLPYGPVPDRYEEIIDSGVRSNRLQMSPVSGKGEKVRLVLPGQEPSGGLDDDDKRILDWVLQNYDTLSTAEISEKSHDEMAYKFTKTGQPIAYRYADYLKKLPPKDLLEH